MRELTVQELNEWRNSGRSFVLIDVREPMEYETGNIDGVSIPMGEVLQRIDEIPREGDVVIHCKSGGRSGNIVRYLASELGYDNLYNLQGGMLAWKSQIDPSVQVL
ncbi:MAG: rhodanese-like domain-containing protein [Bacteroidia bacterium]|nr:rhodanese-like domain-containing protein [Bacteroidia bacterium]